MNSAPDPRPPQDEPPLQAADGPAPVAQQKAIAIGVLALAAMFAFGAVGIPSEAGYSGVGPNFLPWVVAGVLALCGVLLLLQASRGGFTHVDAPSGAARGDWRALAWVVAGVIANAATITTVGFVLSCTLCYVLGVRGLRVAEGRSGGNPRQTGLDVLIGASIALPVYWLFGKLLSITLPGLTASGWI